MLAIHEQLETIEVGCCGIPPSNGYRHARGGALREAEAELSRARRRHRVSWHSSRRSPGRQPCSRAVGPRCDDNGESFAGSHRCGACDLDPIAVRAVGNGIAEVAASSRPRNLRSRWRFLRARRTPPARESPIGSTPRPRRPRHHAACRRACRLHPRACPCRGLWPSRRHRRSTQRPLARASNES